MKYCKVRFGPLDARRYTYLTNGHEIAVGDFVKVDARSGDGPWKRVEVMELTDDKPNFVCKPVLGKVTGEDTDQALRLRRSGSSMPRKARR